MLGNLSKIMECNVVDAFILQGMDFKGFSDDVTLQTKLRDLLWKHTGLFKIFAKIRGVKRTIMIKYGDKPICCPHRMRSPK